MYFEKQDLLILMKYNTVDPCKTQGLGKPTPTLPHNQKSLVNFTVSPLYPGFTFTDTTNHGLCSMYLLKKKPACRWVHAVQICVVQRSTVPIVLFIVCAFCVISRKSLSQRQIFSMFSSKSFIILTRTFMSMMGYELNLYIVWSQHSFFSS